MPNKQTPLFFDTVVLSNFAFANEGISFLKTRYRKRGILTFQVLQEIAKAIYAGYSQLVTIENEIFSKNGFKKISLTAKEQEQFILLLRILGEGEASCLAAALSHHGIVVTDDRAARNSCKELQIPVTGTLGIMKAACLDGSLDKQKADQMLHQMILQGFYSPINKISDIL